MEFASPHPPELICGYLIENVSRSLQYVNTWLLVGGAILGGGLVGMDSWQKHVTEGWASRVNIS